MLNYVSVDTSMKKILLNQNKINQMRKFASLFLCFLLGLTQLFAQNRTITGKVTDEKGTAVPNAAVTVKGTTIGTSTAADGTFSLSVPANAKTLVIKALNIETKEENIGSKSSFNISVLSSSAVIEDVIVQVPYGSVKKTSFTGSEATVSSTQINKQQVTSVTRAIEGLVPGIQVTNGGGAPGTGASILIRGIGSINASASPLYVLNGVPYDGSIAALSNDEIESVTVLKDAAAAALYGSRAANGVIMITTKKGKKGRSAVNATIRQGFMSRGIPEYNRLAEKDYMELMWEATRNSFVYAQGMSFAAAGVAASQQLTDVNHLVYNPYNLSGTNLIDPTTGKLSPNARLLWSESWEDALFQTAARTNANVNVSGASDKTDYFMSMGYLNEEGTLKFSGYKRYNMRLSVNTQATDWFKTGINLDGAVANTTGQYATGTATSNPFYYTRQMGPIYPVYQHDLTSGAYTLDAAGNKVLDWGIPSQMGTRPYAGNSNLLGSLALDDRSTKRYNGNANVYGEIKFLKDFTFKTTLGINIIEDNQTTYQNSQFGDAANVGGRSTKTFDRQISLTANEVLSWGKSFGKHTVRALAGHENYRYRYSYMTLTRTGFKFPNQTELDNATVTESVGGSSEDNHTIESYFGQVNYEYDQKYLASGSYRRDGSSRFAKDSRWGNFYSVGLGWRLSQENFLKNVRWINELKLKASYGQQGNDNIGLYYPDKYYYNADGSGGYNGSNRPASPTLQWESNKTLNVGFDFVFFKKLQGSIEYFNKNSDNLLFDVPLYPSSGYTSQWQNVGSMTNKGIELQLGYNVISKKNFDWRVDFNITHFKNKITKLPATSTANGIINGTKKLFVGKSIYEFWLREYAGVDAATGDALFYKDVLDASGKATGQRVLTNNINQASFYFSGSAVPKFNGGITNSFRYKNFDLSILVTYSYGGKFYDGNYAGIMHSGSYGTAWHSDILNRWQKPGDVTNVPKVQNAVAGQDGTSTRFLLDGSYLNIKNVTLSYTVPKSALNKLHITGLQVFGNIDNAYLFSAKKGSDPQRAFNGTADATYPPFRTITFGLNVNL
jgi:TonB-linked SusC/RagA family outer membrane protein